MNSENNIKKESTNKKFKSLDELADKYLNIADNSRVTIGNIQGKGSKFQDIINHHSDVAKGISGGSILDFAQLLRNNTSNNNSNNQDNMQLTDKIQSNANDLSSVFQNMYQNKFIEMTDLKFISKFIPALGEAVKCTLDAITGSDDISSIINRTIVFDSGIDTDLQIKCLQTIEKNENKLNLQKKLKNVVYKTSLVSGKYYVYAIPYKKLFNKYYTDKSKLSMRQGMANATESYIDISNTYAVAMESTFDKSILSENSNKNLSSKEIDTAFNEIKNNLSKFILLDSTIPEDVLNELPAFESTTNETNFNKYFKSNINYDTEAVKDSRKSNSSESNEFDDIDGIYIRYFDPKNIIPIKLLDETIGYYNITSKKKPDSVANINNMNIISGVFNNIQVDDKKRDSIIDNIIESLSNDVIKNFNPKFIKNNSQFKKSIADCISFNGFMDNEFHVQFIPAEDIIEFVINEDEKGNGESILADSLFPGKLLLSLMVARMLNYLNKSGDKTVYHIQKGPIDKSTGTQVQRVIRNMQETNITFGDLLSSNQVYNKFGRNQNLVMPTSRDGKHLVEFELIDGMNIDMSPEYENKLENMAILGTGVPTVIMEYIGQADFAKGFETGNIKFANRVSSIDADLEYPTTKLYELIIQNSNDLTTDERELLKNKIKFKLPRPAILSTANNSEFLSTLQNLISIISQAMIGENPSDKDAKIKEIFMRNSLQKYAKYIDWKDINKLFDQAKLEYTETEKSEL